MNESDYVNHAPIEAAHSSELRAELEKGGPTAVMEAIEAELRRRADRTARLNAMQQGSVPRDITD